MTEYLFVKPGLATGGATTADLLTVAALRENTESEVRVLTGFCDEWATQIASEKDLKIELDPLLDRDGPADAKTIGEAILRDTKDNTRVIMSQFLSPKEEKFGEVAEIVAQRRPSALRMHNKLGETANAHLVNLPGSTISLPIHSFMERRILEQAPHITSLVVPPIFDEGRFTFDRDAAPEPSVRASYRLDDNDVIILQPTNIQPRKSPMTSLLLASEVQKQTGLHTVCMVAGGLRQPGAPQEAARLLQASSDLGVDILIDGLSTKQQRRHHRIGEHMLSSNVVSVPSLQDDVMLALAEAAYMKLPIFTRAYVDGEGNPLFDTTYGQLDCLVQRNFNERPDAALVQAVADIVMARQEVAGAYNRSFVEARFTAPGIQDKLQELHLLFDKV
jgi:hypothetical protein